MKISIITCTIRPKGLLLVEKALKRQTFDKNEFEWIICSPEKPDNISIPFKWVKDPGKNPGDYWSIYKAYNASVKASEGELLVSWQDWTFSPADTLERFWNHYVFEPNALVTCVGDKYSNDSWTNVVWKDPRNHTDTGHYYEVYPNDIEWNLNSVSRKAIYDVGGFDEVLDRYSSLCGLDVATRLDFLGGYKFMIDQDIKTYSLEHGRLKDWTENEPFNGPWQQKVREYKINPILRYLDKD